MDYKFNDSDDLYYAIKDDFSERSDMYGEANDEPQWIDIDKPETTRKNTSKENSPKEKSKPMHSGHRQRLRERFLKHGLTGFSEYQVLEFLLFFSVVRKDTNPIAHKLIDTFGSLQGVLDADYYDLMEVGGISEVSASLITLHREMFKYLETNNPSTKRLTNVFEAGEFCCRYFAHHVDEALIMIVLDSQRNIKAVEVISEGNEMQTAFYPRKIMKYALRHKGCSIIISHNHPDKNPTPSNNDVYNTNRLIVSLRDFGIDLIDHIVCGGSRFVSMSDRGYIKE